MADWHAGRILLALATYFDWFHNHLFTEYYVDGGIADLVFVSKAGYLTEIEIKISLNDWNADRNKMKFGGQNENKVRKHISRFFYAIPETLEQKIPDWLPPTAGIIVVSEVPGRYGPALRVKELRAAVRQKAEKISTAQIHDIHVRMYYRFWNSEIHRLRTQFIDRPRAKAIAEGRT